MADHLPGERIVIVPLASGWRVDFHGEHLGLRKLVGRQHYVDEDLARAYATLLHMGTGFEIIEFDK